MCKCIYLLFPALCPVLVYYEYTNADIGPLREGS